jgi:hypothetical protein
MSQSILIAKAEPVKKAQYRVTNWPEYRALVQRGSLTVWFDDAFLHGHWRAAHNGKHGAPFTYSDVAIQTLLTMKAMFHLPYRAVEGLARSLVGLMGLDLPVPDHTQMLRRARRLRVEIPRRPRTGPVQRVVDATGLKMFGEGEWKVRQHGVGKRRIWRKVHLGFDADVKDVVAVEVTTVAWTDAEVFAGLLEQVEGEISQVDADDTYDTRDVYDAAAGRDAKVAIPPRENAVQWEVGHPRTQALEAIAEKGLAGWKHAVNYHRRSMAENGMYRLKQLFGPGLASRIFENQVTEVHVRVAALNVMTYLGMPVSVRVGEALS